LRGDGIADPQADSQFQPCGTPSPGTRRRPKTASAARPTSEWRQRENRRVRSDKTAADEAKVRARHVARFDEIAAELRPRIEWSEHQLREERTRALRSLVATAVERSPWHRGRLSGLDVDALTEADIAHLPTMTKSDLMDNFDAIVTDRRLTLEACESILDGRIAGDYLFDRYRVVASSGLERP
jgi:phenylacetate-CoA ligase